jgi:hypothetical protein
MLVANLAESLVKRTGGNAPSTHLPTRFSSLEIDFSEGQHKY